MRFKVGTVVVDVAGTVGTVVKAPQGSGDRDGKAVWFHADGWTQARDRSELKKV